MSAFDPKRTSERAAGWMGQARCVTHCGARRPRAEQQTKRRPHDELCANRATRNFHRTAAGNRAGGLSVDVCYGPCLSVQQKQIVLAEVAASIIAAWQRSAEEQR